MGLYSVMLLMGLRRQGCILLKREEGYCLNDVRQMVALAKHMVQITFWAQIPVLVKMNVRIRLHCPSAQTTYIEIAVRFERVLTLRRKTGTDQYNSMCVHITITTVIVICTHIL